MPRLGLFWKEAHYALSCHLIFTTNSTCTAYYVSVIKLDPNANLNFFMETTYVSRVTINIIVIRGWLFSIVLLSSESLSFLSGV